MKYLIPTVLLLSLSSHAYSATLNVNGSGKLTGATGVMVNGNSYDVEFLDGSCEEVFDGCDELSDFTFHSQSSAIDASQALLDQVFLGAFDTDPSKTIGISGTVGKSYTAFAFNSKGAVQAWAPENHVDESDDFVNTLFGGLSINTDISLSGYADRVWAKWNVSTVPVPAAAWLFGSALIGLLGIARRRK